MPELWTIGRLLAWTTRFLGERGASSPRLDAEVLLAEARGCQRIELYTAYEEVPAESVRAAFRELVRRRGEGRPVAYLVGRREFYSLPFRVSPDVLIPRPETEFLVVALLDFLKARPADAPPPRIADVGTGSGIVAVCAARNAKNARITAVDVSPRALAIARENAVAHGVAERIEFVESDLFAELPVDRRFDFVVSNPPYVTSAEWAALAKDVRDYEPRLALEAGPAGTEVIARLAPQAAERLSTGGRLLLEVSPMIEPAVRALLDAAGTWQVEPTVKDLAGLPRVVRAVKRG